MKPNLEYVLDCMPWTQNFKYTFKYQIENHKVEIDSPIYLSPSRVVNGSFQIGINDPKEGLTYISVGLSQTQDYETFYFRHVDAGIWQLEDEKRDIIYLPLRESKVNLNIKTDEGKLKVCPLYTINKLTYSFPLIIFSEDEDRGPIYHGFYRTKVGNLEIFKRHITSNEKLWFEHTKKLRTGIYDVHKFQEGADKLVTRVEKIEKPLTGKIISIGSNLKLSDEDYIDWSDPKSIKEYFNKFVIGQEQAKKTLAIAASNFKAEIDSNISLPREHVILAGPTGSGKTMLVNLLIKALNIPKASTKLSMNTKEGYVGQSLSDALQQITELSNEEAPYAAFVVDEIDKVAPGKNENNWGNELQDELISLLEESSIKLTKNVKGGRHDTQFNTKNLLCIGMGAFHGGGYQKSIYDIIEERIAGKRKVVGFKFNHSNSEKETLLAKLLPEDFIKYGLKPELVGRFSAQALLDKLKKEDIVKILTHSKDSPLIKYENLFGIKGYTLQVSDTAKNVIAEACPEETGARALRQICSDLFSEIIYSPSDFTDGNRLIRIGPALAKELISKKNK